MSDAWKIERLAREAAHRAIAGDEIAEEHGVSRKPFTITKFGRHEDGYLHARVVVNGNAIYVHRKFGSWMAPGTINGKAVLKDVLYHVAVELQTKARALEKAERKEEGGQSDGQPDTPDTNAVAAATGEVHSADLRQG